MLQKLRVRSSHAYMQVSEASGLYSWAFIVAAYIVVAYIVMV